MTVKGKGAVAIWHDMAAEGLAEFYAWHGCEHMPERVGIEGFIRGRRWIAIEADRLFFNLYETADEEVVRGPHYKARLDNPTPWTIATVKYFRAVARSLCRVEATLGKADGGTMATLRCSLDPRRAEHCVADLMPDLLTKPGIAAAHLLAADVDASSYVNAEQRARGGANEVPSHALLVEGWADEAAFIELLRTTLAEHGLDAAGPLGFYRHQITTMKA